MAEQRSAAKSMYPHLASGERAPSTQRERSLADAMFPSLSKEAKQREAEKALWARINERNRQATVRGLREAVAAVRADKARGR